MITTTQTEMFPGVGELAIPNEILVIDARHNPEVVRVINFIEAAATRGATQ